MSHLADISVSDIVDTVIIHHRISECENSTGRTWSEWQELGECCYGSSGGCEISHTHLRLTTTVLLPATITMTALTIVAEILPVLVNTRSDCGDEERLVVDSTSASPYKSTAVANDDVRITELKDAVSHYDDTSTSHSDTTTTVRQDRQHWQAAVAVVYWLAIGLPHHCNTHSQDTTNRRTVASAVW